MKASKKNIQNVKEIILAKNFNVQESIIDNKIERYFSILGSTTFKAMGVSGVADSIIRDLDRDFYSKKGGVSMSEVQVLGNKEGRTLISYRPSGSVKVFEKWIDNNLITDGIISFKAF